MSGLQATGTDTNKQEVGEDLIPVVYLRVICRDLLDICGGTLLGREAADKAKKLHIRGATFRALFSSFYIFRTLALELLRSFE